MLTKEIRRDMGECAKLNGYADYFACMLLMCNGHYLMDKVFDKRKFVHIRYIFQNLPRILTEFHRDTVKRKLLFRGSTTQK